MKRLFFEWSEPLLPQAAKRLIDANRKGDAVDLSGAIVVMNVGAAGRRLLELLVERTEAGGWMLSPPTITTVGGLPERLYRPKWPFADAFVQRLAWAEALKNTPPEIVQHVVPHPPATTDDMRWLELGQLLRGQHIELAADGLNFADVAERGAKVPGFDEGERWRALRVVQETYLRLLDELELWDRQTARTTALEKREYAAEQEIILIGAVDLNGVMREILDQVSDRVTAFVHAPKELVDRFDDHGCLVVEAWSEAPIALSDERIAQAGGPADQAEVMAQTLSQWSAKYSADEITVGLPDESLASQIERRLAEAGVASRWIGGRTAGETGPARLLVAAADYLERDSFREFAALVRHPDIYDWIYHRLKKRCFLTALDEYASEHFGGRSEIEPGDKPAEATPAGGKPATGWLGEADRAERLGQVEQAVDELLAGLRGAARPMKEWQAPIRGLLLMIYGERWFDREVLQDRLTLSAGSSIAAVLEKLAGAPPELLVRTSAWQVLGWIHDEIAAETIPPEERESAVPLMGWLELALDDAPALVVTSFNEGFVPSSRVADAFLPDRLRSQLGLDDNARRYARDAYAISVIAASRRDLKVVVGRRDGEGNPLAPSRLLFAVDDQSLARRAIGLFGEAPATQRAPLSAKNPADADSRGPWFDFPVPMPQPLPAPIESLAVSDFKAYLDCPYRFYLGRVLKLASLTDEVEELDGRGFGNLAHAVLQGFGLHERRHATNPDEVRALLDDLLLRQAGQRFGHARAPSIRLQIAQLQKRLHVFADEQARRASDGWRIENVERDLKDEKKTVHLLVDKQPMRLRARIDRIDWHPELGHAIFDYKTGDKGLDPERSHRDRKIDWIDLQLPLYRHIGIELGMDRQRLSVGYVVLGRKLEKIGFVPAAWEREDFEDAERIAEDIVRSIRREEFWPPKELGPRDNDEFAAVCQNRRFGRWTPEVELEHFAAR